MRAAATLVGWLLLGTFRAGPGRWVMASLTVAIGLALAVAVDIVNRSALGEFGRALDVVNGQASAQLVPASGSFEDRVFDDLHKRRSALGLEAASPVLLVSTDAFPLLGLDIFRAAAVTPSLLPQPGQGARDELFAADSVFLSHAALTDIGADVGESIQVMVDGHAYRLRITGTLPGVPGERLALMDLGAAQWMFGRVGEISRLDLRLAAGVSGESAAARLKDAFPGLTFVSADDRMRRMSNLSRAYRVNLSVLALVALLTGGFLVFTAVSLSVLRQQSQLALLEVLGSGPRLVVGLVIAQGALIGAIGGVIGIALGTGLAAGLMALVGADLGAGYFRSAAGELELHPGVLLMFWLLALAVGIAAAAGPALSLRTVSSVVRMRAGAADRMPTALSMPWWPSILALAGLMLLTVPAIAGLPIAAYVAIALLLMAGVLATPWVIRSVSRQFLWMHARSGSAMRPPAMFAVWRLSQASASSAGIISGTVAAVSLTVAMVVMVASFRDSVARWLDQILPADIYASTQGRPGAPSFPPDLGERIGVLPGVARVELHLQQTVLIRPDRPEVLIMARPLSRHDPAQELPLTGPPVPVSGEGPLVFVSEAMADLHAWQPGHRYRITLGTQEVELRVAGIFRDYGRQHGSIIMDSDDVERITGDRRRTALGIWLAPSARADELVLELQRLPELRDQRFMTAAEIRALSLQIFDRSFVLTYVLELAALVVAIFSVAAGFAGQAMLRRKEFALLAHLGLSRGQRNSVIVLESGLLLATGIVWGSGLGLFISQILIHRVNPQSFHWTMETSLPGSALVALAVTVMMVGVLSALLATARGLADRTLARSLQEDW